MKNKFSKFINLQGKYLTSLLILLTLSIGNVWGAVTTEVYDASGASSSVAMTKTGSTLAGTYIAGQGGGAIQGYSPSNKGVKLRTQTTKVTLSETEYGYAVITANDGYSLKSFKLEGTSNGSNSINLLGVYVDVDATNATTLAADLATATNQLSSTVTIPNKSTDYVSSPVLSIDASSNIVMLFPGTGDNQMRAIITIGYEEASSGIPCTDATVSFAATSDAIEIGSGESSASTSLTFSSDNASTASYAVTKGGAATADASVTGTTFTATAAGEYVGTVTQAKDETNNICAVEEAVTITVTDANIVLPGATLTAHTPGTYESPTGYNVALTEYNEREYETYFFSYSSSKLYLGIGGSYVTDNTTPRLPGFDGVANGDLTSTDNWLNINAAGFSGSNTSPAAEFAVSHSNNSTHYAQIKEGNDFIIKVQGYDQFSFGGRENGTGSGKQFVVTLNGVEQTISHSSTDWNLWRFDLNPATEYIIMVSGDGSNANRLRAFSLRLPEVTKYDVAFAGGDYGTGSMTTLKYKAGATVTAPACGFSSSDATKEFDKWGVTGVAGTTEVAVDGTFAMPAGNVTLTALWKTHAASSDATLKDLTVNGVTVAGFDPATEEYNVVLEMGTTTTPEVAGVPNDDNYSNLVYVQTSDPTDDVTVTVTAENGSTSKTYTIHFSIATSKDIELVWATDKQRCDATTPSAKALIATASTYLSASYTGSAAEGGSLNTGKTTGSKIIITAKPGYAFKAMGFYGKIEDGTCNFYNDGVVETIGTSNSDACYADVFSNDEVHEFVIELTGSNGVYIRNMQLTIIEACTPVVITWDEEPVEFEVGKAGQAIAATANNGGTITYGSTDASIVAVDAGNGVLSVAALGSVSLSASTPEGDGTTYCDNSGTDIVISKAVNTYYLVKFDGQNGEAADEVKFYAGDVEVALPASDPLFAGHTFAGWFDAATGGNAVTAAFTPAASMTLYAHWTTDCTAPTIDVQPASANYFTGRTAAALNCEATAAGGNALTYKWYSCDDDQKTNPQELSGVPTPSTAAAGTSYFFCAVTEEGCANVANSNVAVITVADKDPICLAWVDVTGENTVSLDEDKSLYAPSVSAAKIKGNDTESGGYGGRIGWKFNSAPGYIAIEGAPFKSGDIVEMFVTTTTADKARVFNANEAIAANIIAEGAANMVQGANRVALTADANNLYLRRGDDFGGWNPYVAYVAVYRACTPILNKVTVAGVEGTPDNTNHVAIEVPFSTTDAALSSVAIDWISNNAAWDAAHDPDVANAWEFGVENTVTLTDKDGESSVYYVTISKAVASTNVELATLTVNGNAVDIVPGQDVYNYELPYGSAAPTVAATAEDSYATVGTITQAASATGSATFTVTAEDGSTHRGYTINFSISKWAEVVIWDGSYMTEVAASPGALGLAWEIENFSGVADAANGYKDKAKAETKMLVSNGASPGKHIHFVIPAGYVAKFYTVFASHSESSERGFNISTELAKNPTSNVYEASSVDKFTLVSGISEIVGSGDVYFNPNNSIDFYEIRAYLRPGYKRIVSNNIGTLCVNHNVAAEDLFGATYYQIAGLEPEYGKIAFDEVTELVAGEPYIFRSNVGSIWMFYGDDVAPNPVKVKGMVGSFNGETLDITDENKANIMYIAQNKLWNCEDLVGIGLEVVANRCYIDYSQVQPVPSPNPAPGRRRVSIGGANVPSVATDIDNLNSSEKPVKLLIDGQLFIIRGEKMFDATGRLVK